MLNIIKKKKKQREASSDRRRWYTGRDENKTKKEK